jgi:hypothetical protein
VQRAASLSGDASLAQDAARRADGLRVAGMPRSLVEGGEAEAAPAIPEGERAKPKPKWVGALAYAAAVGSIVAAVIYRQDHPVM